MSEKRIENDEQLQKSQEWLLEKAKQLDHPLMDEQTKAQMMPTYDFVSQRVMEYRREQTLQKFPTLRKIMGIEEPDPAPAPAVNLSDWID